MTLLNFEFQDLVVDWININIQDLPDPKVVASGLSNYFTSQVLINGKPKLSYHGFKKNIKFLFTSIIIQDLKVTG